MTSIGTPLLVHTLEPDDNVNKNGPIIVSID